MNQEVWRYRQRLEALFERVARVDDAEMQAHWARYLCVLTSGFLEVSMRSLISQYAGNRSQPEVVRFVDKRMEDFQSAKMGNICTVLRQFDPGWGTELERQTEGELKDAVDSIVANRHLIAHGRDVGMTYVTMFGYYRRAVRVIDLIRATCDP